MGEPVNWVGQSLGISKVGQTVLTRLMESQIWHLLASCVTLLGEGLEKGQWLARHFSFSQYATDAFQAATLVLELKRSKSESVSPCVGSLRGTFGLQQFLPNSIPAGIFSQELWGLIFLALETWAEGPGMGLGLLAPEISPEFLSTTCECGTSPLHICAPPSNLDGCGFSNSVVRLPYNSMSDTSERWWFYILVVISMRLWQEVSHVCPCCHLVDQKSLTSVFNSGPVFFPTHFSLSTGFEQSKSQTFCYLFNSYFSMFLCKIKTPLS